MEDNRIIECIERAHYILSNLMAVKPGEEVLIAIDPQTDMRMANAMAADVRSRVQCKHDANPRKRQSNDFPENPGAGNGGL